MQLNCYKDGCCNDVWVRKPVMCTVYQENKFYHFDNKNGEIVNLERTSFSVKENF